MDSLAHQNIEVFAHYLHQLGGGAKGRDKDYWYRAEKELSENLFCDEYPLELQEKSPRKLRRAA